MPHNKSINIQPLQFTPEEAVHDKVELVRNSFLDRKTRSIEFRKVQLRKLYWSIHDNVDRINEALARDLSRPKHEANFSETAWIQSDLLFTLKNLDKWLKDEPAPDIPLTFKALRPRIRKDPMGAVLIVGPCNYPFQLTMVPLFGAIAAGNTVVLKPSEISANCAVVMQEIIEAALDPSCYTVVQGSIPQMQALIAERWDKIFFTGSTNVGRIISKAAAVHMTPVVLELGGLNPAIVTRHANPRIVARRLLWAKTMNAGQTCTAQNYILIEKSILPRVMEEFRNAYKDFYPDGNKESPDYSRIITDSAFQRLKSMIDESKGKIIFGGTLDEKERYIEPTFIQVDSLDDSMIVNEAFGPICAVMTVDSVDEAIKIATKIQDTTLGLAVFGTKEEQERVMQGTRSGSVSLNDAQFHLQTLPFGGVGESGTGAYRGRSSFDVFVHRRPYTTTPGWMESLLDTRYPPYRPSKEKMAKFLYGVTPDFDREGRQSRFTWLKYLLGGSPKAAAGRAAVVAVNKPNANGQHESNGH